MPHGDLTVTLHPPCSYGIHVSFQRLLALSFGRIGRDIHLAKSQSLPRGRFSSLLPSVTGISALGCSYLSSDARCNYDPSLMSLLTQDDWT